MTQPLLNGQINRDSQLTQDKIEQNGNLVMRQNQQVIKPKIRIQSLDIYRGLTMVGMIVVDNMGPIDNPPWWLQHPQWHGLSPADFIFPAFLFIMGMAIPLAVSAKNPVRLRNIIRIAGLFLIGFFLNCLGRKFDFENVRILGILQRLSICYALMIFYHSATNYGNGWRNRIGYMIMFLLFIFYTLIMILFQGGDVQGCTRDNNMTLDCNFAGYMDRSILTRAHIWRHRGTDPEGTFSTLGALFTTFMGYNYSLAMAQYKSAPKRLVQIWLLISIIFGALVYPATLLQPFNKQLYTSSFVLIVVAVSGASLTFFYLLVDIIPSIYPSTKTIISIITRPLKWLGLNPLAIFVLMDLVGIFMIIYIKVDGKGVWNDFYKYVFASWIDNAQVAACVFAGFFVVLWTVVAGIMNHFKIYVRL